MATRGVNRNLSREAYIFSFWGLSHLETPLETIDFTDPGEGGGGSSHLEVETPLETIDFIDPGGGVEPPSVRF